MRSEQSHSPQSHTSTHPPSYRSRSTLSCTQSHNPSAPPFARSKLNSSMDSKVWKKRSKHLLSVRPFQMQAPAEVLVYVDARSASRDGARGQPLDDGQTCGAEIQARAKVALPYASFSFVEHDGPDDEKGSCVCILYVVFFKKR
jgi:hypothetical protein